MLWEFRLFKVLIYMSRTNQQKEFILLIKKYLRGEASTEQINFIRKYYEGFEHEADVLDSLTEEERKRIEEHLESSIMENIASRVTKPVYPLWKFISTVAAIVLIIFSIKLYFDAPGREKQRIAKSKTISDIKPGGNNAILTLTDGSTIVLNDMDDGQVTRQAGVKITKTKDGMLTYTVIADERDKTTSPQFNTISTPKGGQYQILLPDGTRVWLNAASSLKYPTVFSNRERRVVLTGEAYFEVKSQLSVRGSKIPFFVGTSTQVVEVLGTHFNINSYSDEPFTKTTLIEGSVRVTHPIYDQETSVILKPSEQSAVAANHYIGVSAVNTSQVIAWKSGLFQFEDSDIKTVMRELSRWYNVEVEFEGTIPNIRLWGKIHRNVNASEALKILGYFDLKYRIVQDGNSKKVIISA
jgi:transmembrane sensor